MVGHMVVLQEVVRSISTRRMLELVCIIVYLIIVGVTRGTDHPKFAIIQGIGRKSG